MPLTIQPWYFLSDSSYALLAHFTKSSSPLNTLSRNMQINSRALHIQTYKFRYTSMDARKISCFILHIHVLMFLSFWGVLFGHVFFNNYTWRYSFFSFFLLSPFCFVLFTCLALISLVTFAISSFLCCLRTYK